MCDKELLQLVTQYHIDGFDGDTFKISYDYPFNGYGNMSYIEAKSIAMDIARILTLCGLDLEHLSVVSSETARYAKIIGDMRSDIVIVKVAFDGEAIKNAYIIEEFNNDMKRQYRFAFMSKFLGERTVFASDPGCSYDELLYEYLIPIVKSYSVHFDRAEIMKNRSKIMRGEQ